MYTKDFTRKFNSLEVVDTDSPAWWEGYIAALVDNKIISEKIYNRCLEYITKHRSRKYIEDLKKRGGGISEKTY
jgi:hypothetical protein